MDTISLEGYGVFISSLIVFCGSIWLLLAVVLGSRLAYFITASVTLGFVLIMSVVWSFTQLGPVGQLPSWDPLAIGTDAAEIDFSAASSYPEGEWHAPDPENDEEITRATEAEGGAAESLTAAIDDGDITTFEDVDPVATPDSTRVLEQNDQTYGATLFQPGVEGGDEVEPAQLGDADTVLVVVEFDPGNTQGLPRKIAAGTLLLFGLHLFGLSRAERKAKRVTEKFA